MDTRIQELARQLHAAQQRAAQAEEEKARAEEEKILAQEERNRAEEEKTRAEEETRATTLSEYIEACHELVYTKFTVETKKEPRKLRRRAR